MTKGIRMIILIICLLILTGCDGSTGDTENEVPVTMEEAVQAVKEYAAGITDSDVVFDGGAYIYRSQEAYKEDEPFFEVDVWREVTDIEFVSDRYFVEGEKIISYGTMNYGINRLSEDVNINLLMDPDYEAALLSVYSNRISELVDMTKEAGYGDITSEIFDQGFQLQGGPLRSRGENLSSWYVVTADNPNLDTLYEDDILAVAYNTETEELFVPQDKAYIFPRPQGEKDMQVPADMTAEDAGEIVSAARALLADSDHPDKDSIDKDLYVIQKCGKITGTNYKHESYDNLSIDLSKYFEDYLVYLGDTMSDWEAFIIDSNTLEPVKMVGYTHD